MSAPYKPIKKFSLEKLNPSPAAINFTKFDYSNKLYIKALSDTGLTKRMLPYFEKAGTPATLDTLKIDYKFRKYSDW